MNRALAIAVAALAACSSGGRVPAQDLALPDDGGAADLAGGSSPDLAVGVAAACSPTGGKPAIAALGAGGAASCVLYTDGRVLCWGDDSYAELGNGKVAHDDCGGADCAKSPVPVLGVVDAVQLAVGPNASCAVHAGGTVSCWGINVTGDLGDGVATHDTGCSFDCSFTPVAVAGLADAKRVSMGDYGTACAVRATGGVVCWGNNDHGQLGDGVAKHETCTEGQVNYDCARTPVAVQGLTDAIDVGVDEDHACALRSNGHVSCWGSNEAGQIGDGTTFDRPLPTEVAGLDDAIELSVSFDGACALRAGGTVVCWGYGANGELGDGQTVHMACPGAYDCSPSPVTVQGLAGVKHVSGHWTTVCALRADGTVACWGDDTHGELGDGVATHATCKSGFDCAPAPVSVVGLTGVTQLSVHAFDACALRTDCSAACWGMNPRAQLGDGTTTDRTTPTPVTVL